MLGARTIIENVKYKEYKEINIGINYVEFENGQKAYVYFEDDYYANCNEEFYSTLEEAMVIFRVEDDSLKEQKEKQINENIKFYRKIRDQAQKQRRFRTVEGAQWNIDRCMDELQQLQKK